MNELQDMILDALNDGMNIKLLVQATGIDSETFMLRVEYNKFSKVDSRRITETINKWKDEKNLNYNGYDGYSDDMLWPDIYD